MQEMRVVIILYYDCYAIVIKSFGGSYSVLSAIDVHCSSVIWALVLII